MRKSFGFALSLVFAFGLMVCDHKLHKLNYVRLTLSNIIYPLQFCIDYPANLYNDIQSQFISKNKLIEENMQLKYQQTLLEVELQRLVAMQEENSQLKQLLLSASKHPIRAMATKILSINTNLNRQLFILDKGKSDGVYIDQPVIDAKGIMGQIIDLGDHTSTIMLITDSQCAVPIRNLRTGEPGIVVGQNDINELTLINLPLTSTVKLDDLLVTSGFGKLYPEGYPVGKVINVTKNSSEGFIQVAVKPIANLKTDRLALLLWPSKSLTMLNKQIADREKKMESL